MIKRTVCDTGIGEYTEESILFCALHAAAPVMLEALRDAEAWMARHEPTALRESTEAKAYWNICAAARRVIKGGDGREAVSENVMPPTREEIQAALTEIPDYAWTTTKELTDLGLDIVARLVAERAVEFTQMIDDYYNFRFPTIAGTQEEWAEKIEQAKNAWRAFAEKPFFYADPQTPCSCGSVKFFKDVERVRGALGHMHTCLNVSKPEALHALDRIEKVVEAAQAMYEPGQPKVHGHPARAKMQMERSERLAAHYQQQLGKVWKIANAATDGISKNTVEMVEDMAAEIRYLHKQPEREAQGDPLEGCYRACEYHDKFRHVHGGFVRSCSECWRATAIAARGR